MPWLILISSAVFEAVWAVALSQSEGFTKLWPTVVFVIGCIISMAGLGIATKKIPIGTGYAVWAGIGAALTVVYSMLTGAESISVGKVIFISGIILAVVGLKLVPSVDTAPAEPTETVQPA